VVAIVPFAVLLLLKKLLNFSLDGVVEVGLMESSGVPVGVIASSPSPSAYGLYGAIG